MDTPEEKRVLGNLTAYKDLARNNSGVDEAGLALAALESPAANFVPLRKKRWAYIASVALPPVGIVFALWYFFAGRSDGKRVAAICFVLSVVSTLLSLVTVKMIVSSLPPQTIQQIESIDLDELRDVYQVSPQALDLLKNLESKEQKPAPIRIK